MSYSRWMFSCWYTFNHVDGGFCVCAGSKDERDLIFSLKELQENMDACIELCYTARRDKPTVEEIIELKEYMNEYIADETRPERIIL